MATTYQLNHQHPQPHQVNQIVNQLNQNAVILYPTDTVYAVGCDVMSKTGVERVRYLKRLSNDKPLTFLCSSLSDIATYAVVSDPAYRIMKRLIPGPYTFLLPATKVVPKLVMDPKRRTTGIRVPDHHICQALLKTLGRPIISTSAKDGSDLLITPEDLEPIKHQVDIVIEDDAIVKREVSTILDLTTLDPIIVRQGAGYDKVKEILDLD
jgi:tRNA threonylcarbamoyl adenosine modification protein (Sua5/YciO/YrdC/YwlC family)